MKTVYLLCLSIIANMVIAQTGIKTQTLLVKGNCEECKERIENAADIKGVKNCVWNSKTKIASVTYDSTKVTLSTIETAIAGQGHETGSKKADEKAYKKLPKCCQYKDQACEEPKK